MNERDALRYAARRAAFIRAVRDGDASGAARASARLRVFDTALAPAEFARALDARRALGRAIVNARLPKAVPAELRHESPITALRESHRKRAAAIGLVAGLIVGLLVPWGMQLEGGGAPESASSEQQRTTLATVSRGRTVALPVDIVVVIETPSPEPSPTPEPSASASASPAPQTPPPAAGAGGVGTGTASPGPGGGGGQGGGNGPGNGSGNGPGNGTATPRPVVTLGPVPSGFARMVIIVTDAQTRRPISDVCVVVGTANCLPGQPHTDANGRWSADVAATALVTYWDVSLIRQGYVTVSRRLSLRAGSGSTTYSISMRRSS